MECNFKELTYEEALEFYNRWGRTILVGSSPTDFYKTNKIRDKRSLDDCIKQYLNYYDGPVRFFLDPRTRDNDMRCYNKNESKNMNKKLIRLTESDLHRIVKESVNRVLNEIGDTSKGQRALGGLHARKVLRNNDLSRKTYDYAEKARGGDKYDNRGNNDNPLYHDYANGYVDYLNSHPSEYMDNKRKRMAESKEDYDYIMSVRNNPIFQQELKKAWDKEIKTNPNPDFDSFEYRFATNYLNKQMEQERWGISMHDFDKDAYYRDLNPSRYYPDGY